MLLNSETRTTTVHGKAFVKDCCYMTKHYNQSYLWTLKCQVCPASKPMRFVIQMQLPAALSDKLSHFTVFFWFSNLVIGLLFVKIASSKLMNSHCLITLCILKIFGIIFFRDNVITYTISSVKRPIGWKQARDN